MADLKISQLSAATALAGTEVVPVVQSGGTKKATIDQILSPASGKGVNFAAAGGDVLTIYGEGTWTPTRNGFTEVLGGGTITSTGRYTRIGNVVNIQAQIVCAGGATISATSGIGSYLSGLPFTPSKLGSGTWVNGSSVAADGGFLVHTNTNLYITTGWAASSSTWYFSATYFV